MAPRSMAALGLTLALAAHLLVVATAQTNVWYCRSGWTRHNDWCYLYDSTARTWPQAEANCKAYNAHLASFHTPIENNWLVNWNSNPYCWIGATDQVSEGSWTWSDNTPWDYSNWNGGEPNNWNNEDCAHITTCPNGDCKWNDLECSRTMCSVCRQQAGTLLKFFSCGFNAWLAYDKGWQSIVPGGAHYWVNGVMFSAPTGRGFNVYVFNPNTAYQGHTSAGVFDTYASTAASASLVNFLNAIPNGQLVSILCFDECSASLTSAARNLLSATCGSVVNGVGWRDAYMCVYTKGAQVHYQTRHQTLCQTWEIVLPGIAQCPAGTYRSGSSCVNCPKGTFSTQAGATSAAACQACPAGKFGTAPGVTTCTGVCSAGYYCPPGSTSATQYKCPAGVYGRDGDSTSSCYAPCPAGKYCPAGTREADLPARLCNAGRYSTGGATAASCLGPCDPGYVCPAGSASSKQTECGGPDRYCPLGSSAVRYASTGYYTVEGTPTTRSAQLACPEGYYCVNGVQTACPAGTYNNQQARSACTKLCSAGYFCDVGSAIDKRAACGAGVCAAKPAACYCPAGAATRVVVSDGYYTTSSNMNDYTHRTGQAPCGTGFVCTDGIRIPAPQWQNCNGAGTPPTAARRIAESTTGNIGSPIVSIITTNPTYTVATPAPGNGCRWAAPPTITVSSTGQLKVTGNAPDYELCSIFSVILTASSATESVQCSVQVSVDDVNEAPYFNAGTCAASRVIEELSAKNAFVGAPVTASDNDMGQAILFRITGGTGQNLFSISPCSGQIMLATDALHYADASSYTLTIRADDNGTPALSATCTVTVGVTNRNDPPTVADATFSVTENSAPGTLVGTFTASDPDGDALTFSISNTNPANLFTVNSQGKLQLAGAVDYEVDSVFYFQVTVTDGRGGSATADVTVNVLDADDKPSMTAATVGVAENSAVGTLVGDAITVDDQDVGDTFTVSIESGDDNHFFAFTGLQLKVAKTGLDFETTATYNLNVKVTDRGGASCTGTVTVLIGDVNEAPSISAASRTVSEGVAVSTSLGAALTATDPDDGQTAVLVFSITGGNTGNAFLIDGAGTLVVATPLDFETTASYTLTITVRDSGGLTASAPVTVTVTNVNEAPYITDSQTLAINENSVAGTTIGSALAAVDPERDAITFTILSGNDGNTFAFSATTAGQLVVSNPYMLDYETRHEFSLLVQVSDPSSASSSRIVTIALRNVNEAPTWEGDTTTAVRAVAEQSGVGTLVGSRLTATDPEGDAVTYRIVSQPAGNYYAIDATTGQVSVAATLPSVGGSTVTHDLVLGAADSAGISASKSLQVSIVSQNHPPTIANAARSIQENSAMGTSVGTPVTGSDPDNDALTYSIVAGSSAGEFVIDATTGQISVGNPVLDFEATASYTLRVVASDSRASGAMTAECLVTITITDVPESPSVAPATVSVPENSAVGTTVGDRIVAVDQDAGETAQLVFSLTSGRTDLFAIGSTTGQITVQHLGLDYERTAYYTLTVQATDPTGRAGSATVSVLITNVNDAPTLPSFPSASVREDAAINTVVGIFTGQDQDGDALTYAITNGNTNSVFAIDSATGAISVAGRLDYETRSSYTLGLAVTDPSGAVGTSSLSINVQDVNEAPSAGNWATVTLAESTSTGSLVATASFTDPDAGTVLSFQITDGNSGNVFAVSSTTGVVTVAKALNFESTPSYFLEITATDQGGLSAHGRLTVLVGDVNEAPSFAATTRAVNENSVPGTSVGALLAAEDPDAGDVLSYSIVSGNTGSLFSMSGAQLLVDKAKLNYEHVTNYQLQVQVMDSGGLTSTSTVTVEVLDVNEAPLLSDATRSIAENSEVNSRVGAPLVVSDEDFAQLLSFSIIAGNELGHFRINTCDGQLQVAAAGIDFETKSSYTLTVSVTDDGTPALSATATVTVTVDNVNEAPVVTSSAASVAENSAVGTVVTTVTAADPDTLDTPAQSLSFSIVDGNYMGLFAINAQSGVVSVATAGLDFERRTSYLLTIHVSDSGTPKLSSTGLVSVTVTDVNDAPTIVAQTRTVTENSAVGTVVGAVLSAADQDAGANGMVTFSIASGTPFSIVSTTGQLVVAAVPDFETTSSYQISVTVTDGGGLTATAPVTVTIVDVNEAPVMGDFTFTVNENSARGTVVGTVSSTDPDAAQILSYAIVSQSPANAFYIRSLSGVIEVADVLLNYEVQALYTLAIQVTDNGNPSLSTVAHVSVNVANVWEAPVVAVGQSRTIVENAAAGTYVGGVIVATDEDAGDTFSFAIVGGNEAMSFGIGSDGQLQVSGSVDYETLKSYTLQVVATDSHGVASAPAAVAISVTDVNEAPVFSADSFAMTVAEDAAVGVRVGLAGASDPDTVHTLTWTLVNDPTGAFQVLPTTGDVLILRAGVIRALSTYTLSVRVADQGGLTDTADVVITVSNVNHPPVLHDAVRSVAENAAASTLVGAPLTATDPENDQITWRIVSGNDNNAFGINPSTGQLYVVTSSALDYEARKLQVLRVQARDNGAGALSSYARVNVTLTDVNEAPVVATTALSVKENSALGTLVGRVVAVDPDAGDSMSFAITDGNVGSAFTIDNTGAVKVGNALNSEALGAYSLTVTVTDRSGLKGSAVVAVAIEDVNDAPVMKDTSRAVSENVPAGTPVGAPLVASDEDLIRGVQSLSFSIVSGNSNGAFSIDASGQLSVAGALDFETQSSYTLTVQVSDNGSPALSATAKVSISIGDVNESPYFGATAYSASISENSAVGTLLTMAGGSISAADPEAAYQQLKFTIVGDSVFTIASGTGVLSLKTAALDFETRSSYDVVVQVSDNAASALTATTTVHVVVNDVNEAPYFTAVPTLTVKENSDAGTLVAGRLDADDVDAGSNGHLQFAIVSGDGANVFSIDKDTGLVYVAQASLDFETQSSYSLKVEVSDGGSMTAATTVTVLLLNVNEAPVLVSGTRAIAEDSHVGAAVAEPVQATDVDVGQTLTLSYAITGGDGAAVFGINSCSGQLMVRSAVLDFETKSSYTVIVTVTDDDSLAPAHLTATATYTITIEDINEAPVFTATTVSTPENSAVGTKIGAVLTATDEDLPAQPLTFSIVSGNDAGLFAISTSGQLSLAVAGLNYEAQAQYSVLVHVVDSLGLGVSAPVIITVTDVNEAPVLSVAACSAAENTPTSTLVCEINAVDVDAGPQSLSFALSASGNTNGAFSLTSANNKARLLVAGTLNFETQATYTLSVTVTDDGIINGQATGALSSTGSVVVQVTNQNEPPVMADQARAVNENAAVGTPIGAPLVASDPDEGTTFTYTIVSGNVDSLFDIVAQTGQLIVAAGANFEAKSSYQLVVRVADSGFANILTASATVTVTINDVNEAPTLTGASLTIAENSRPGVRLMPVTGTRAMSAADVDAADVGALVFSITAGNVPATFDIDRTTGDLYTISNRTLDFETQSAYQLLVTVTDAGGLTASATVNIAVTDVNEAPYLDSVGSLSIREHSPTGTAVTKIVGHDVDAGDSLTYFLSGSTASLFAIDSSKGILTIANGDADAFSYTAGGSNQVSVTAGVRDRAGLSSTVIVTITIIDNNVAPLLGDAVFSIEENKPAGTQVGILSGSDENTDQKLTYSIVATDPVAAAPLFAIRTQTVSGYSQAVGVLVVADTSMYARPPALDFETFASVTITVQVTDDGPGTLSDTASVRINLQNVNEAPVISMGSNAGNAMSVNENVGAGTHVGSPLVFSDPDADDSTVAIALSGSNLPFGVDASGQVYVTSAVLNYEAITSYAVIATVTDHAGLTASVSFTVNINNVNEAPSLTVAAGSVAENSAVGTSVTTARATDPDANTVFKFSFAPGNQVTAFAIDASSGVISVAGALDYEAITSYTLVVRVRDDGLGSESLSLYADVQVTITIQDVNDVSITGFNTDGSATPATVVHSTSQAQTVYILGTNFGPTAGGSVTVTASYAPTARPNAGYSATDCSVVTANTIIRCKTVAGVGSSLVWTVTVNGASASSTATTSYAAPTVSSIGGASSLSTAGGATITVSGSGFGPVGTTVDAVQYGPSADGAGVFRFKATSCSVTTADSVITCSSAAGVGTKLQWRVTIALQNSAALVTTSTSYAAPSISSIEGGSSLSTSGGDTVTLKGSNFGRSTDGSVSATYGRTGTEYTATSCAVTTDNTVIKCNTVAGVGSGLTWVVTVGGQSSSASSSTSAYQAPSVSSVSGPGASNGPTRGQEQLFIAGSNFGPVGGTVVVTYGGSTGTVYTASSCTVTSANVQITCLTVEGTGRSHSLRVQVGDQWSSVASVGISYAPPSIISYSGDGASNALTRGGQTITITGNNFGSASQNKVSSVKYGRSTGTLEFTATNCKVTTSHTTIQCTTVAGAGAGLRWSITIDGQESGTPTTNYAKPTVTAVSISGGSMLSTDGGQRFTLSGTNFGPSGTPTYLESVTYGPTGTELAATDCVVNSDTSIQCTSVAGIGSGLKIRVVVGGQASTPSSSISYNAPSISDMSPANGATNGGNTVTITGADFGLATYLANNRLSTVQVSFGGTILDSSMVFGYQNGGGQSQLSFTVPECADTDSAKDVVIEVSDLQGNSQYSAAMQYTYDDPSISGVYRLFGGVLRLEGENFGLVGTASVKSKSGVITTVQSYDANTWSHNLIELPIDIATGSVFVTRGTQSSNTVSFTNLVPSLLQLGSGSGSSYFNTEGGDILTISGYDMQASEAFWRQDIQVTVTTVGADGSLVGKECALTSYTNTPGAPIPGTTQTQPDLQTVQCSMPPGQGDNQRVTVTVRGATSPASLINYEHPWISSVTTSLGDGARIPTSGLNADGTPVRLIITGRNFGVALQSVNLYRCDGANVEDCASGKVAPSMFVQAQNCVFTQTTATCDLPEGEGSNVFATISINTPGNAEPVVDSPKGQYNHMSADQATYGFADARRVTWKYAEPRIVLSGRRLATASGAQVLSQTGPTSGNFLLTLGGENFGRSAADISVTVGPYTCTVVSHTHSSVTCRMPAGQGTGLPVLLNVAGTVNTEVPVFNYLPPALTSLTPKHGPTSGVASNGAVVLTITGTNLGTSGVITFGANSADAFQDDVVVPAANIVSWTHTSIVFRMPAGQGTGRQVYVAVSGQKSGVAGFDYDEPVVDHLVPDTDASQNDFLPTAGFYNVTVMGANFGTRYASVQLSTSRLDAGFRCGPSTTALYVSSCTIVVTAQTHTSVKFLMPRGIGKDFSLRVIVGKQMSEAFTASYDAPQITRVRPNIADAEGQLVKIDGKNFGDSSFGLNIAIHGVPCTEPQFVTGSVIPGTDFVEPAFLQCRLGRTTVGAKNISLAIAGQSVAVSASSALLLANCQPNFYGRAGELCLPCPFGAHCVGGDADPVSVSGFWVLQATGDQCPAERLAPLSTRTTCPESVVCEPRGACSGENHCSGGYSGERCALCSPEHYRRAGECVSCPNSPMLLVAGFIVLAIILCCIGFVLNKRHVNLAFVSIGVDYFQVLALFASSKVSWPATLKEAFVIMSAFNFNLEITAPECSIPHFTYDVKWFMVQALPLAAGMVLIVCHVIMCLHKYFVLGKRKNIHRHGSALLSTALVMFYYLYLYLTRTSLDVFNCAPTDPSDGHTYLEVVFERCDLPGGLHQRLLPFAVVTFCLYSLGYPALLFFLLYRNRMLIMEDQLLRAKGTGGDRFTNIHAYDVRKRFHKLYYHFKPDQWYWILAVLFRKVCLAFTALMFDKNPAFQLAMALLVMFLAYTAQVKYRPYMSVSENTQVLREHKYKAEMGDPVHVQLAENLALVQARTKQKGRRFTWSGAAIRLRATLAAQAVGRYFWNYNTVEMVLLFSAVLVNLAGIMFQSGQLDSEYYQEQRDLLMYAVLLIIAVSVTYFAFVLVSEIYGTICREKIVAEATAKSPRRQSRDKVAAYAFAAASSNESTTAIVARKNRDFLPENTMDMAGVNPYFRSSDQHTAEEWQSIAEEVEQLRAANQKLQAALAAAPRALASPPPPPPGGSRRVRFGTTVPPPPPPPAVAPPPTESPRSQ